MIDNNYIFGGQYGKIFNDFVSYKRSLGIKYKSTHLYTLKKLCEYLNSKKHTTICLTKQDVESYIELYNGKSISTIHDKECAIRQLAFYLKNTGYKNIYIYPETQIIKANGSFVPYIFTQEEIINFFEALDNSTFKYHGYNLKVYYETIFRVLYATGMRVGEVLNLKIEDIDLENDIITVLHGKDSVSRLIPFLPSLHYWLEKYKSEYHNSTSIYFFETIGGKKKYVETLRYVFKKVLNKTDFYKGQRIRVHDLRHTFACHSFDKAIKEGKDPFCAMPYISTYMGHKDIRSTELYLRLTEEHYKEINDAGHYIYEESLGEIND